MDLAFDFDEHGRVRVRLLGGPGTPVFIMARNRRGKLTIVDESYDQDVAWATGKQKALMCQKAELFLRQHRLLGPR